jgi:membrane-associated phospholipid phosphatase
MNQSIFYFFYNLTHQSSVFDQVIIFLAVYFPFIVLISAGLFLLFHHEILQAESPFRVFLEKKREILTVFFSFIFAFVAATVFKLIIHIDRSFVQFGDITPLFSPHQEYSFPSSHAAIFSALAVSIFLIHKKAGYVFIFFALLVGIARIIAGVHFPLDILGGFVLGGIVAYLVAYFAKKL